MSSRPPSRLFALTLASIAFISPLAVHLFLPAIPVVKQAFGVSSGMAQLTFSIALFAMAFSTLLYGSLSDRYGRRPVLLSGLALFLAGSAISSLAVTFPMLIAGRLVQAIGAGCGTTLVRAIARDAYGPADLVKAIAYLTMFYTIGPMVAPIASGILIDAFGWRTVFLFSLACGTAIMAGAWLVIYETKAPGDGAKKGSSLIADYVALVWHARFTAFVSQTGFNTGVFFTLATGAAVIMQDVLHRPAAEYGYWFLAFPFGFLAGNFVSSRVARRVSIERMVLAGSLAQTAIVAAQALWLLGWPATPLSLCLPGFFVTFAQGLSLASGQAGAMAVIPRLAGTAAGVGVFAQMFLSAVVAQVYGMVADGTVRPLLTVMAISAACALVSGVVPTLIRNHGGSKPT